MRWHITLIYNSFWEEKSPRFLNIMTVTRLRVDKDKPKGWFMGNWKGDYSKLCYFAQL